MLKFPLHTEVNLSFAHQRLKTIGLAGLDSFQTDLKVLCVCLLVKINLSYHENHKSEYTEHKPIKLTGQGSPEVRI